MPTLAEAIKKNLKQLRKAKGYESQEALSIASGVARTTIARYESGAGQISADSLSRLAKTLGVDETDLVHPGGPPKVIEKKMTLLAAVEMVGEAFAELRKGRIPEGLFDEAELARLMRDRKGGE
jgi:transcriptional regulator with XRE-family HTH domain